MKKTIILMFLLAGALTSELRSQTIADTLEMAYNLFSKRDYKASAAYFNYFLSKINGHPKDYYLAGVCHANMNDPEKSLEYLNKAANGKAEYYMMLNDPELKTVQPQIVEIIHKFNEFEKVYKQLSAKYSSYKRDLVAADSVYHLMPSHKIQTNQLKKLSSDFLYVMKDTVKYLYYLNEEFEASLNKERKKELAKGLEKQINAIGNKLGTVSKDKLLAMSFYRYFYAMSFRNNSDSLRYHFSRVPFETHMKFLPSESYIGTFEYYVENKNFNQAYVFLYTGLANGNIDLKKIFKSSSCSTFFKQPVGKAFLSMLLSESLISTIESSDRFFVASAYQSSSSKREKYNFLQAMKFNGHLPDLRKYLVRKNVYGPKTMAGKSVIVSETYPYGLYTDEFEFIIDTSFNITPVKNNDLDFFNPKEEVILVKSASVPDFTYTTGEFFRQPVANIPFLLAVKNGKVKKSVIPLVRTAYFNKLVSYGIKGVFYDQPDRDDIRYFGFNYDYNGVESCMEELMRSPQKEDIGPLLEFIQRLAISQTNGLDFLIRVLGNPEQYMVVNKNSNSDETYYNLIKLAKHYIADLVGENEYNNLKLSDSNKGSEADKAIVWKDAAIKIAAWWDNYKKASPYTFPPIIKANIAELKGMPNRTKNLMLGASNKILFYNPSEKDVFPLKVEPKPAKGVMSMDETIESAGDYHDSDISGIILGDTGYVFTPNHRDRPSNLNIIPGLTRSELESLKQAYSNLRLSMSGRVLIEGDYDKSYNKFYAFRYNKRLAVCWFADTTLYTSFLGDDGQLSGTPVTILRTRKMKCAEKGTLYSEMNFNMNSLQVGRLGENLLLVCNVDIKENPNCSNQKSRVYVELLNPNLQPIREQSIMVEMEKSFDSNPKTEVKTTNNNAYVFVQGPKATNKINGTVFNQKLDVVNTFNFDQNLGGNYEPDPLALIPADGDNIYCLYSRDLFGDVLLAISKVSPHGQISKPAYIYQTEGSFSDYKGYFAGGNFVVYLIEKSFQKDRLKKITVPVSVMKFVP